MEKRLAEEGASSVAATKVTVRGPTDMIGNHAGDSSRDLGAVNSIVAENVGDLNTCFEAAYVAGEASEGEVAVEFTILASGRVVGVGITSSTVASEVVEACVAHEVDGWHFQPSSRLGLASPADVGEGAVVLDRGSDPMTEVRVIYPFRFSRIE